MNENHLKYNKLRIQKLLYISSKQNKLHKFNKHHKLAKITLLKIFLVYAIIILGFNGLANFCMKMVSISVTVANFNTDIIAINLCSLINVIIISKASSPKQVQILVTVKRSSLQV